MPDDVSLVARHAESVLPLAQASLGDEYYYQSVPLSIIDAVYSIGVRYAGVRAVVDRYCRKFDLAEIRRDKTTMPPEQDQESVSAFVKKLRGFSPADLADKIFENRQRTSTRSGILKAEAVQRFAGVLASHGLDYFQDVPKAAANRSLETETWEIPGQRSGISLKYFWMLVGSDTFVKPDRMIRRFLESVLRRTVSPYEAENLVVEASARLALDYSDITPRLLDHEIWKYQRQTS